MKEKKELSAQAAKEKALRLLEFRAHSEKELCDKLIRAGARRRGMPLGASELRNSGKSAAHTDDAELYGIFKNSRRL